VSGKTRRDNPMVLLSRVAIYWIGGLLGLVVLAGCKSDRLNDRGTLPRGRAAMSRHRLFCFKELKEPKAARGLFPSLLWRFDVGEGVIEVWQDKFVLAADSGGVEYDAGQIEQLLAARFKKRRAEASSASRNAGGEA
jgi:hypothetical protein